MKFTFQINGVDHSANWSDGIVESTAPEVITEINRLKAAGKLLPLDTIAVLVAPTLERPEGAYAVIAAAVMRLADYNSWTMPIPPYPDWLDDGLFH